MKVSKFFIDRPVLLEYCLRCSFWQGLSPYFVYRYRNTHRLSPHPLSFMPSILEPMPPRLHRRFAAPIEETVNGVENMLYMQSLSNEGWQSLSDSDLQTGHRSRSGSAMGAEPGVAGSAPVTWKMSSDWVSQRIKARRILHLPFI